MMSLNSPIRIRAGGPNGGPSLRNRMVHISQRRLHCPAGSIWTRFGSLTVAASGSFVLSIGFFLDETGTGKLADGALDGRAPVVPEIDGPREPDEIRPEILPALAVPELVLHLPELAIHLPEFRRQLPQTVRRRDLPVSDRAQVLEFLPDMNQPGRVADLIGLDLQDRDLVDQLPRGNFDHDVHALISGESSPFTSSRTLFTAGIAPGPPTTRCLVRSGGPQRTGSARVNTTTLGTPNADARCDTPVSFDTSRRLCLIRSARPPSPRSGEAASRQPSPAAAEIRSARPDSRRLPVT